MPCKAPIRPKEKKIQENLDFHQSLGQKKLDAIHYFNHSWWFLRAASFRF
jgi:hypothetical protein